MAEKTCSRSIVSWRLPASAPPSGYSKWSCTGPSNAVLASIEKNVGKRTMPCPSGTHAGSQFPRAPFCQTKSLKATPRM